MSEPIAAAYFEPIPFPIKWAAVTGALHGLFIFLFEPSALDTTTNTTFPTFYPLLTTGNLLAAALVAGIPLTLALTRVYHEVRGK